MLISWKGSMDNHLAIKKGEVIWVTDKSGKWWSGEIEGRVGWFPKPLVKVLEEEEEKEERRNVIKRKPPLSDR